MLKFGECGHPVFRATSPLSRGTLKSRGCGKLSIHFCADGETMQTVFRTVISVNQLRIYRAVSDLCEECKSSHVKTGRPVLVRQSDPLFVSTSSLMKTPTPSTDDPAQEDQLQKNKERVDRLSQQDRVIKICTDAGFLKTVELGQYFMTKDIEEFSQFTEPVTCREYTLPRDEKSTDPGFEGRPNLGPYWKSQPATYKVNLEWHSWVRISHGLNKLVTDLSNKEDDDNEQETSVMQFEDFALKTNVFAFASRPKAKAKPRRRTPACLSTRRVPISERFWTDIEPDDYSSVANPVSKQLSTLLRHGDLPREEDGAIEFWRIKDYLRNEFVHSQHWSDEMWKSKMAGGGVHSGRNPIDPEL